MNVDQTAINLLFSSFVTDNEAEQARIISLSAPTKAVRSRALELLKFHHSEDLSLLPREGKGRVNVVAGNRGSKMLLETRSGERDDLDTFELQEWIGSGTTSDLFLAKPDPVEQISVAVKVPRLMSTNKGLKRLSRELLMMELASHPNVIRGIRVGVLANYRPFLMMEHVPGIRLTEFLKRFEYRIEQVFDVLTQISVTIGDLHRRGIAHCDLNPDNIIVTNQPPGFHPIIIDFGSSQPLDHVRRQHFHSAERFTTGAKTIPSEERLPIESPALVLRDIRALAMMAYAFTKTDRHERHLRKEYGCCVTREIESIYYDLALLEVPDTTTADEVAERFANIASRIRA